MLSWTVLVAGLTAGLLGLGATPALASPPDDDFWGGMDCSQYPLPGCELSAGSSGAAGNGGSGGSPPPSSGGAVGSDGGSVQWDRALGPGMPLQDCRYVRSDYRPPAGATRTVSQDVTDVDTPAGGVVAASYVPRQHRVALVARQGSAGAWYVYRCSGDAGLRDGLYRPPVFLPDAPGGGPAGPSLAALARQAYAQLRLPSPMIGANPRGPQLVRLPTWLWIEHGWEPVSATASVPGVTVTATAAPDSVTWSMGDGGTRRCDGPGTPYTGERGPRAASPDCGYVYRSASGWDGYPVTATLRWRVSWSGAGRSGTFDGLTTSTSTTFVVAEVGAVNGW